MLGRVQEVYPHVSITFADLYNSAMLLVVSPREFGKSYFLPKLFIFS